jgi:FO synthase
VKSSCSGRRLSEVEIASLFEARDHEVRYLAEAANELRASAVGEDVSYVVNRNINYTNICTFKCSFCAFSKGSTAQHLRGTPYDLGFGEIVRRSVEAWDRGATEVCLQGGIHPDYTGSSYLDVCRAIKSAVPGLHIHAFSPLEISHGSRTLGISLEEFFGELKAAGLGTLPGTAAEILDDEIRRYICPDKIDTATWLGVIRSAHHAGLRTTSTIMFGHIDAPLNWARHLLAIRDLQAETGGITEFVPLPFVHMEAPMYVKGVSRRGPTSRETILMHSIARLSLHPLISNVQASWVKLGIDGVKIALTAGANDLGGTLMNESISRAAGTTHGQELPVASMKEIISSLGRKPRQRSTLYGPVDDERIRASCRVRELSATINEPPMRGGHARLADRYHDRQQLSGAE